MDLTDLLGCKHEFGGDWTELKLDSVRQYLEAYIKALKGKPFELEYIDAFAGTGYRDVESDEEGETRKFLDGSARIALQLDGFARYTFVEKNPEHLKALEGLKKEFPNRNIEIINEDANTYIQQRCTGRWTKRRAVMFLDPYGLDVEWKSVEAIARTEAIDLWYLVPIGQEINRHLSKDVNKISEANAQRLTRALGTDSWRERFYGEAAQLSLLDDVPSIEKTANFKTISDFVVERLSTCFPGVAPNPLFLYNSKNVPIYMLCFAASNKRGAPIAIRIAGHILNMYTSKNGNKLKHRVDKYNVESPNRVQQGKPGL